ncbi:enoyl-CoA hydratase [Sporosarcina sp. P12(2017)]|uniref:enoyl-CoA hydratase/isomerase family protein n=1 Tax=unclassified Sporosarcina TaxID=2647733 RepID=UPI000C16CAFA|nr:MULTISPECIES: enoyl-CoA hydratase-related protein [unclassified Sporosarcina]PIC57508.1 enoyl-CoA hydratase [Sporosarcina sp. P10]PIC60890.1 enoyl-CoA hydratase [Sporosarcina sp. P12(2017)]
MTAYKFIETSVDQQIGVIELNRPKQLNSLNRNMVGEILEAMQSFDRNDEVRVILLVGKGKAFSAGADIDEMAGADSMSLELLNQFADWDQIPLIKKPVIGAVHGFVFGGGFELALCCDVLLAADGTEFSFPEVTLGVMPGAGGTQRLTKLVGRAKAIEWLWTGERIKANELQEYGVINRIVSPELLHEEALRFANKIASMPPLAIRMIKDSVNKAVDYPLYEGMQYERKNFYLLFSSEDQKEGMQAFVEKRKPVYKGR